MTSNRHHANRPTSYTPADHARIARATAKHDAAIRSARVRNAIYRVVWSAMWIGAAVAIYQGVTG